MPEPVSVRWRRIFAVLISMLVLVEGGCRMLLWKWSGVPYKSLSPYVLSPYGVVRNNPLLTSPAFHISPDGFRDFGDYSPQKPPGTLRILLLGGSTLYSGLGGTSLPGKARVGSGHTIAQFLLKELQTDPELQGTKAEVLNAGVNYNRVVEVSTAYLGEFMYWQPDFVIVCSSGNDFVGAPRAGEAGGSKFFHSHPWQAEFDRQVNSRSFLALLERVFRGLQEHSAALAILAKVESKMVNVIVSRASSLAVTPTSHEASGESAEKIQPRDVERWVNEYLAQVGALGEAATTQGQKVVFVWEYFLAHLKGRKPFTDEEKSLFEANKAPSYEADAKFRDMIRDRLASYSSNHDIIFIDPLPALRIHRATVFIDPVHYTIEGNAFMAGVIYQGIKEAVHVRAAELRR